MDLKLAVFLQGDVKEPLDKLFRIPIRATIIDADEVLEPEQDPTLLFDESYFLDFKAGQEVEDKVQEVIDHFMPIIQSRRKAMTFQNLPALRDGLVEIKTRLAGEFPWLT